MTSKSCGECASKTLLSVALGNLPHEIIKDSMLSAEGFWNFLMRRLAFVFLLVCVGCSAQSNNPSQSPAKSVITGAQLSPELKTRIEHQVRAQFELPPDVTINIGPTRASDIPGFDALTLMLDSHGKQQKVEFLLAQDGKTLARMTRIDLSKDIYAERMSKIDMQGRPVRGNPDAKVTIVNYDDYQCPFCSRMHTTLTQEILPQYGDKVKLVYKDYPLPMHPWAKHAANDANCLAKENPQGFWEFTDYVHANQRDISGDKDLNKSFAELDRVTMDLGQKHGGDTARLQACIKMQPDDTLKASMREAESMGVQATPTMFINGERLEGAVDPEDVKAVINAQLKAAGIQPPPEAKASAAAPAK
jgi:protein-disulfide isomerase